MDTRTAVTVKMKIMKIAPPNVHTRQLQDRGCAQNINVQTKTDATSIRTGAMDIGTVQTDMMSKDAVSIQCKMLNINLPLRRLTEFL